MRYLLQRNNEVQKKINIDEELQKKKILKSVDSDKKHQHDKLMDEFRKAHRKMFNSSSTTSNSVSKTSPQNSPDKQNANGKKDAGINVSYLYRYFNYLLQIHMRFSSYSKQVN